MADYYDQPTFGSVLDIIEQDAEITFQAVDYANFEAGKPFKSGELSIPETPNNRAILGSLFDADGSNKVRIIENATYQNDAISLGGSIIITGQEYKDRINILKGFFVSGNALLWLDFGDTNLRALDWSEYEHTLNYTNVHNSELRTLNSLITYDLTDRGKFIDVDTVNLIERYPAWNIAEMLRVIFKGYSLLSNFIAETWFADLFILFTQNNEIRNTDEWRESALFSAGNTLAQNYDLIIDTGVEEFYINDTVVKFTDIINDPFFENGSNYNVSTGIYKIPETGTYRFIFNATATLTLGTYPGTRTGTVEFLIYAGATVIGRQTYTITAAPTQPIILTIDSDFIELIKDVNVTCYFNVSGQYTGLMTDGGISLSTVCTFENIVSRYYGYGSTIRPSELLPDLKVNDFLKMVFNHFAITAQYSNETNIVRLNTWKRSTTGHDLTYMLNPVGAEAQYTEGFNYDLIFKPDTGDAFGADWYDKNPTETGNYKANNGFKVFELLKSDFSNTVMQIPYRLDADKIPIPTMYNRIPNGVVPAKYTHENTPDWKTSFNYRILVYDGVQAGTYKLGYHVANHGRTVVSVDYYVFKPYTDTNNIEFADRAGVPGLHTLLHGPMIGRVNNGLIINIQGPVDLEYMNDMINCDAANNLSGAVYIGFEPFIGYYTVQKITTDGIVSQYVLIRNEE
jgi:hypothetical protein